MKLNERRQIQGLQSFVETCFLILFAGGVHLLSSSLVKKIGWQLFRLIMIFISYFREVSQLPR